MLAVFLAHGEPKIFWKEEERALPESILASFQVMDVIGRELTTEMNDIYLLSCP